MVLALAHYVDGTELWLTPVLLTATAVIMRCDMVLLAGTVCLSLVLTRRMRFWTLVRWGVLSGALALAATVAFDSLLWGRVLWPEGKVLWFNTVLNKCAPSCRLDAIDGLWSRGKHTKCCLCDGACTSLRFNITP